MKTYFYVLLSIVTLIASVACSNSSKEWARTALQQKMQEGALIADVRTHDEYAAGHIKGAINVPHDQVKNRLSEFGSDPAASIVVYCGHGGRAAYAQRVLEENGYTNVWNLGSYSELAQPGIIESSK